MHTSTDQPRPRALKTGFLALAFTALAAITPQGFAASGVEIDARVNEAVKEFRAMSTAGAELMDKAAGVLIFPRVLKAGIGIGGEFGEGSLRVNGETVAYYNVVSGSIGFQFGGQVKKQVILFMTASSLEAFRDSQNWKAGVDGSVAIVEFGAGQSIDTKTIDDPIIGFIFGNKGLMYNLTFEGSKFTRLNK